MMEMMDANYYYIKEHVCRTCGNICSREAQRCPVCGEQEIDETVASRSNYELYYCKNRECLYATQREMRTCPHCASDMRGCEFLIPEDHWALPVPSLGKCKGELKDDDEAYERCMSLMERR